MSPLDQFVSTNPGTNDVKVPEFPKLMEMIKAHGFQEGITQFDQAMEALRQELERTLNERLAGKAAG